MVGFVTVLLCSNLIGPAKTCVVAGLTFGAGNLFFPISYIFGDILTEVYGYARARKVIWAGFAAMLFATLMAQVVLRMPPKSLSYRKGIRSRVPYRRSFRVSSGKSAKGVSRSMS